MKKILILEDEEVLGRIYKRNLEKKGFHVSWARNLEEAEKKAKEEKPDLALIDHGLKGKTESGLDLIPKLRKLLPVAKLIMLSNYSQHQLEEAVFKAGGDGFLVKLNTPPKSLAKYVENLLGP